MLKDMKLLVTTILPLMAAGIFVSGKCWAEDARPYSQEKGLMIEAIENMVRQTSSYIGKQSLDPGVMAAMLKVPRHEFVPEELQEYAYENRPLPIGEQQTISQPYIVALMTDLAGVNSESRVLEIGTGSGYQAAVLGEIAAQVYTIEIIEPLGQRAKALLKRLGYANVIVRVGDGFHGWEEYAPFDAVIVTAAPEEVPGPLLDQLKPGGRLVIPVGQEFRTQSLRVYQKSNDGEITMHDVLPVGFVPLTRDH